MALYMCQLRPAGLCRAHQNLGNDAGKDEHPKNKHPSTEGDFTLFHAGPPVLGTLNPQRSLARCVFPVLEKPIMLGFLDHPGALQNL